MIAHCDEQVERKAQRLKHRKLRPEQANAGGVAEAVLKGIDPELLEQVKDHIARDKALVPTNEKSQEQAKHQERPKLRQKKRDQGMEL